MSLAPATRVGPYEIETLLGSGGMGEVYRARDSRLRRLVALKVLRSDRANDPERQSRLLQEARAASALQHPHIMAVHDILSEGGALVLVLEYVHGRTLDEIIPKKGLRLSEVLHYGIQIADALAAAHGAGVIHRDLKPSNIMIADRGVVKLLDFGLAKLLEVPRTTVADESRTVVGDSNPHTQRGGVLGTVSYMSPEQAEGKPVDERSDIFIFGCVLYEMITGQRAFGGGSTASILSAILRDEPKPPSSLCKDVPRDLERIILRCLRKDPNRRWQNMADLHVTLEDLKQELDSGTLGTAMPPTTSSRGARRSWVITATLGATLFIAAVAWILVPHEGHLTAALTAVPLTSNPGIEQYPTFSPDGNQIAFSWNGHQQNNFDIYVKVIGVGEALRLTADPAKDYSPAWSPDGRQIGFLRDVSREKTAVMLIPALGGTERKLTDLLPSSAVFQDLIPARLLAWSPDNRWLVIAETYVSGGPASLVALSLVSGERRRLTTAPSSMAYGDANPALAPDGRNVAFSRTSTYEGSDLYVLRLAPDMHPVGEPKRITFENRWTDQPVWSPDGRTILFASNRAGTRMLWRMPFGTTGSAESLAFAGDESVNPAVSRQGNRLAYVRSLQDTNIWQVNVPAPGQPAMPPIPVITSTVFDGNAQFSPDGHKIAYECSRSGNHEIWVAQSDGSHAVQVSSFGRGRSGTPRWSPDGAEIVFDSNVAGTFDIYVISAEGGTVRRLTTGPGDNAVPSWSRDGKWIYFTSLRTGTNQIWKVPATGGEAKQVTRNGGAVPFESPDGSWLYYKKRRDDTGPLWRMRVNEEPETVFLPQAVFWRNFVIMPTGIYFMREEGTRTLIEVYRFATNTTESLATLSKAPYVGLTVTPDEKRILYTQVDNAGRNVMLVENFR